MQIRRKIDENSYAVVNVELVTKALFLHNTTVVTSKINKDKYPNKIRDISNVQGIAISGMYMCHVIRKYPELFIDINFIVI